MPLGVDIYAGLSVCLTASEEPEPAEWFADHYPFKHIIGGHSLTTSAAIISVTIHIHKGINIIGLNSPHYRPQAAHVAIVGTDGKSTYNHDKRYQVQMKRRNKESPCSQ